MSTISKSKKTPTKTPKTETKTEGYEGHNPGSRIGQMHEVFDKKGREAAEKFGDKLGLNPATIAIQCRKFEKASSKKAKLSPKLEARPSEKEAVVQAA